MPRYGDCTRNRLSLWMRGWRGRSTGPRRRSALGRRLRPRFAAKLQEMDETMSEAKPRFSPNFEEFAVRVMYFMTTIDSFVPMAGLASWLAVTALLGGTWTPWVVLSFALTLACFTLANY